MEQVHAVQAMIAHALAEERPLGPAIAPLGPIGARAARFAEAGDLHRALRAARFRRSLLAVGKAWPRALEGAKAALDAHPTPNTLVMRVRLLLGLLGPLVLIHMFIAGPGGILHWKILPVFAEMFAELGAPELLTLPGLMLPLGLCLSCMGWFIGVVGSETSAVGTPRAMLDDAAAIACVQALQRAQAPAAVTAPFLRRVPGAAGLEDRALAHLATERIADAHRRVEQLDFAVRVVGFGGIALSAISTTWHLYGAIARLGGLP